MKRRYFTLILCSVVFSATGQQDDAMTAFINDFTVVSETYYERMIPYIDSLAEKQFSPLQEDATEVDQILRRERVRMIAHVNKTNVRKFIKESFEYFKEKNGPTYNEAESDVLINLFDFGLRTQFPYLDYVFYEETKTILAKKMKS